MKIKLLKIITLVVVSLFSSGIIFASETASGSTESKWDVNTPPGSKEFIEIDVDEGTWMNLDVSPDGKTLIFDLLGDLYTMPIAGGTARSITSGMSWDMQPRFSPDG